MEELEEREVMWPDHEGRTIGKPGDSMPSAVRDASCFRRTRPMDIPFGAAEWNVQGSGEKDEDAGAADEMVPPHVLIELRGRVVGNAAFSVCYGQGRTLKGRDLRHVRDSVLRMTGFLEG